MMTNLRWLTISSRAFIGRILLGVVGLLVTVSQVATAQTGYSTSYEPSSRQRLRSEACMKDEVDQSGFCIKRCDEDFKLEMNGKKATCRATKSGATRKAIRTEYQTPQPATNEAPSKSGY